MSLTIPPTAGAAVIRTHFGDDAAWNHLLELLAAPQGDFQANVDGVSDAAFEGATPEALARAASPDSHMFLFVADGASMSAPDYAPIVVPVGEGSGQFRVVPSEAWSVENNLSLGNMDFTDFLGAAGPDGVFRGFPA